MSKVKETGTAATLGEEIAAARAEIAELRRARPEPVALAPAFELTKDERDKHALTTAEKSQIEADRKFAHVDPAVPRWRVKLVNQENPKDDIYPLLILPATNKEEAVARYQRLCGIIKTDRVFSAVRADGTVEPTGDESGEVVQLAMVDDDDAPPGLQLTD